MSLRRREPHAVYRVYDEDSNHDDERVDWEEGGAGSLRRRPAIDPQDLDREYVGAAGWSPWAHGARASRTLVVGALLFVALSALGLFALQRGGQASRPSPLPRGETVSAPVRSRSGPALRPRTQAGPMPATHGTRPAVPSSQRVRISPRPRTRARLSPGPRTRARLTPGSLALTRSSQVSSRPVPEQAPAWQVAPERSTQTPRGDEFGFER